MVGSDSPLLLYDISNTEKEKEKSNEREDLSITISYISNVQTSPQLFKRS